MNAILKLQDFGQSCWLDNLTRGMISSGELARRVSQEGPRGVTSNPAIFSKAISSGSEYDPQIRELAEAGRSLGDIYEALVVEDIRNACDILRPVYDSSEGGDGFVSLEVSPYLAHDADGTLKDARRLFAAVERPNCLIKIPGTPACVPVIEQCLYEGININITLLFSIASYEAVAQAYICALERRASEGKPVRSVASVASFFLSRIDVLVDQLLGQRIVPSVTGEGLRPEHLFGKAALASAKLAYQRFKEIFGGERWQALSAAGARVQKPLWASTSTKDPLYDDVVYVEPLVGPHTINTMPEATIAAFADHGRCEENAIERGVDEARRVFADLKTVGIDIDFVTQQLVDEGVRKFVEPFDSLITILSEKRARFLDESLPSQRMSYGASKGEAKAAAASMNSKQIGRRLAARDPFIWTADAGTAAAVRNRLGWLDSVQKFSARKEEIRAFASEIRSAGYKHVVLCGMGGSSLCPDFCYRTFGRQPGWPELIVLDNTDPAAVREVRSRIVPAATIFVISSKSGTTTETMNFYRFFQRLLKEKVGTAEAGSHFVSITDPRTALAEEAAKSGFRRVFENPPDIGGRYSALSYFGLVPMALVGVDCDRILESARQMSVTCGGEVPVEADPALSLGAFLGVNRRSGRDKVTFLFSKSLEPFGSWLEQLLAESTGKNGTGLVPIDGESPADAQVYGPDRVFVYVYTPADKVQKTHRMADALEKAGHPLARIELKDRHALGGEFLRWELATAAAGAVIGVNPFDEPNVAESKTNTRNLLAEWVHQGAFEEGEAALQEGPMSLFADKTARWYPTSDEVSFDVLLHAFAAAAKPSDYLALLAYFKSTPARTAKLQAIRTSLRNRYRFATTLGYGPRYLHSTGQLHKGGPDNGVFIVFTADAGRDLPIPGEKYGFATLQRAQALGDYRALRSSGRRVIRIHLGQDVDGALKRLAAYFS